jgi:hypothetical protein
MLKLLLLSVPTHHGEAADPDLLHWIKGVLDHLVGAGPWVAVALLGILVVAIPTSVVIFYVVQQRRSGSSTRQSIRSR